MIFRRSAIVSLVTFLGFSCVLVAQQAQKPTLDEILQRLQANLNHYDRSVPNLFCDEHVVSRIKPDPFNMDTVTDSTFRLKRSENPDHAKALVESREIRRVNGMPPTLQTMGMGGPTIVSGAFANGFAFVSLDQKVCMKYTLERIHVNRSNEPYIVNFETALTPQNHAACLLREQSKGRVFIDPASMEITHLELTIPHHVIIPADGYQAEVIGKWTVTVDYAPVVLDGDTFWMPSTIRSREVAWPSTWSFAADYRNYHRTEVKSRILPGEADAQ